MAKQTVKYSSACQIAAKLNIPSTEHQEQLYQSLNTSGYYWNSKEKIWEKLDVEAHPPTEKIKVRVTADARFVEKIADECISAVAEKGLRFLEKSDPYNCRPPKQLEARVYLDFMKEPES